jgi:transposase-like protein
VKPANELKNRRDLRLLRNQTGKRECVIIMRERKGKSLPFVVKSEAASVPLIEKRVETGTTVYADDNSAWDVLNAYYPTKRINHSERYAEGETSTNQAESFFSRLRRAEIGTHHRIAGPNLDAYAGEMGWRENHRRESNGAQYLRVVSGSLAHPVSRKWKGYWQRGALKDAAE